MSAKVGGTITGRFNMSAGMSPSQSKNGFKVFGDDWRINWIENEFFILHHHNDSPKSVWLMCVLENNDTKKINYVCRSEKCNTKVPAGIVTAALTRRLSEAR